MIGHAECGGRSVRPDGEAAAALLLRVDGAGLMLGSTNEAHHRVT
jgi:hypothetical protein